MTQQPYGGGNVYAPGAMEQLQAGLNAFVARVYAWMTLGLLLTGIVAMLTVSYEPLAELVLGNQAVFIGLLIGEVVLVIALSWAIGRISAAVATAMFVVYAAVNGVTMSVIFLVYTQSSIATTFFATAGMFGAMSAYGYFTRRDLTSIGSFLYMALVGLIIASVVNLFWANSMLYWLITYAGIAIFIGLTAYDTQKIKAVGLSLSGGGEIEVAKKAAIMGALKLYLDFINLFLLLLRLLGRRR